MTLSNFGNSGSANNASATSLPVTIPAHSAGQQLILVVACKAFGAVITTPTGWEEIGQKTNGSTASGTDTGSMQIRGYKRISDGTEGASVTVAITSSDSAFGITYVVSSSGSLDFDVMETTGTATAATSHSCTFSENPDLKAGDFLIVVEAVSTDLAVTHSSLAITATGITMGTITQGSNPRVTTGNQCGGTGLSGLVSSGTASAAPVFTETLTASTNQAAAVILIRVRELTRGANVRQTFEHGSPGSNYVSGDGSGIVDDSVPINVVTVPASGTFQPVWTSPSVPAIRGSKLLKVQTGATAGVCAGNIKDVGCLNDNSPHQYGRGYIILPSLPTVGIRAFQPVNDSTGTTGQLAINTAGKVVMFDTTAGVQLGISANAVPLNSPFRLEYWLRVSPTTGRMRIQIFYDPDSDVPDDDVTSALGNTGFGPGLAQGCRFGMASSTSNNGPIYMDELEWSTKTWVGRSPRNFIGWGQPLASV